MTYRRLSALARLRQAGAERLDDIISRAIHLGTPQNVSSPPKETPPPPETLDAAGKVISWSEGYDPRIPLEQELALATRFDVQLVSGFYASLTPGFRQDDPEIWGFLDGSYIVRGTLRKDDKGKPIIMNSINDKHTNPLYDVIEIKSTLTFPDYFEVERGGDRGRAPMWSAGSSKALLIPGGHHRLLIYLSEPGAWVSVASPSAYRNGGFRLAAEKTYAVDKVGKPIYREVSVTPLPAQEVYHFKSK